LILRNRLAKFASVADSTISPTLTAFSENAKDALPKSSEITTTGRKY